MAGPRKQTDFDPARTPYTTPAPRFTYIEIPVHGRLMVNSDTLVVTPMKGGKAYPGVPVKLPKELMEVHQPFIRTCGTPIEDTRGNTIEKGCLSAIGGGCPILNQYGRVGPCHVIVEKNGHADSIPCHLAYTGMSPVGRPTTSTAYLQDGWNILTDRTTIPNNIKDTVTRRELVVEMEVPDLAPFYDHLKQPKKKRGRPKKEASE